MNDQIESAPTVHVGLFTLHLNGVTTGFRPVLTASAQGDGVWIVDMTLTAANAVPPPDIALRFDLPARDIHCRWMGNHSPTRTMEPDWGNGGVTGRACSAAPLICLHSADGRNRLTMAGSDPLHLTRLRAGLNEESANFHCDYRPFASARAAATVFHASLRIDVRDLRMERSIAETVGWWESLPGLNPLAVPDVGRLPMYSTWYSFHQALDPAAVEHQCRLARDLGCAAVIVDDGWQTMDGNRGYAFCGDWKPDRIPDMAGHVRRIHDLGMQYLLWYSVPFVGHQSQVHKRFAGKYLRDDERLKTAVLDPRFPDVRDYLIGTYEQAVREWNLDGLKLDFVDSFTLPQHGTAVADGGRDFADVDESVTKLLADIVTRLRPLKPELLIEFRQSYVGPMMRTYGNLFRAGDCPNDAIGNRLRTLDIRLMCGSTACHSDMVMWNVNDPVESAALQMVNILFSVPQVSMLIDRLPASHQAMLRFWLGWWIKHRATLLDGELSVGHPELGYTQAAATSASEHIACAYSGEPLTLIDRPFIAVVNATRRAGVILFQETALGRRRCVIRDTCGTVISDGDHTLSAGVQSLAIPAAGLLEIH